MQLERTNALLRGSLDKAEPVKALLQVLESAVELLQIPENDFMWSGWDDAQAAIAEVSAMIAIVKAGGLPDRLEVGCLFAPTGSLQEVSLSSGWGKIFLKVARKYDTVERWLWPKS